MLDETCEGLSYRESDRNRVTARDPATEALPYNACQTVCYTNYRRHRSTFNNNSKKYYCAPPQETKQTVPTEASYFPSPPSVPTYQTEECLLYPGHSPFDHSPASYVFSSELLRPFEELPAAAATFVKMDSRRSIFFRSIFSTACTNSRLFVFIPLRTLSVVGFLDSVERNLRVAGV
jgi:hypothetical protein